MVVLLVEDEADLAEIISLYLQRHFGAEVLQARTAPEAVQALERNPKISCVVCDYFLDGQTAEEVYKATLGADYRVPFILCSSQPAETNPLFTSQRVDGFVYKPQLFDRLKQVIEDAVRDAPPARRGAEAAPAFCRLRADTFLKLGILASDLYVRLSDAKYVKVFNQGDLFETEDLRKYDAKNIGYLYIRAQDAELMLERLNRTLEDLARLEDPPTERVIDASIDMIDVLTGFNLSDGITPEQASMIDRNVNLAVRNIRKNVKLGRLFDLLNEDPTRYLAAHGVALSYIACGIATLLDWTSDLTYYKLTLASFLHDITLKNDALAQVRSVDELQSRTDEFSVIELRAYLRHPTECAAMIRTIRDIPLDVDTIVEQHHELPGGKGFPKGLGHAKISPLSAVLIVAHRMLDAYYDQKGKPDLRAFVNGLGDEFNYGYFRKVREALAESLEREAPQLSKV